MPNPKSKIQNPKSPGTIIITGAYGSGKTEIAMALAMQWATDSSVTLVDLDFVNPYYRSQDHRQELEELGVRVVAPDVEVAPIDAPALPAAAREAIIRPSGTTLVDLGGDPAGAIVIGQFAAMMTEYEFWAVVNFSRPSTPAPRETAALLQQIAAVTRLHVTGVIGNTHLGADTTPQDVLDGLAQLRALAQLMAVPIVLLCAPAGVSLPPTDIPLLTIKPRLRQPWSTQQR